MNELALFAGAGGGILGTRLLGFRTVCAVEIDAYAREILLRRQEDGILEPFAVWDNARSFDGKPWRGIVDVVTAGFPCQPFSAAGKQRGQDDGRNLWPETIRIIREVEPAICVLENVPGLLRFPYFGTILGQISEAGYVAEWDVVSAQEVGAPHIRERLWIVAYANGQRQSGRTQFDGEASDSIEAFERSHISGHGHAVPDANSNRRNEVEQHDNRAKKATRTVCSAVQPDCVWWEAEPGLGRVVDGMAYRVDRLKAIGNGQVPRVVVEAWNRLRGQ